MAKFVKGQSGNPGGRPKSAEFRQALKDALKQAEDDSTRLNQIAKQLVAAALAGDRQAIFEIAARIDAPSNTARV